MRWIMLSVSAIAAMAMVIAALWMWQMGPHWAFGRDKPDLVIWSARLSAIAAVAAAQAVVLLFVIGGIYSARRVDVILRVLSTTVFAAAAIVAIALGWAGH